MAHPKAEKAKKPWEDDSSAQQLPIIESKQEDESLNASEPAKAEQVQDGSVAVNVPKAFKLTLNNFTTVSFQAGPQRMKREHAEHWYSVKNGVVII